MTAFSSGKGLRGQSASFGILDLGLHPKIVSERLSHRWVAFTLDPYSHVLSGPFRSAGQSWTVTSARPVRQRVLDGLRHRYCPPLGPGSFSATSACSPHAVFGLGFHRGVDMLVVAEPHDEAGRSVRRTMHCLTASAAFTRNSSSKLSLIG